MGSLSWVHWLVVLVIVVVLFGGRGKLSGLMGDAAKGIRAFKDGLKDGDAADEPEEEAKPLPRSAAQSTAAKDAAAKKTKTSA